MPEQVNVSEPNKQEAQQTNTSTEGLAATPIIAEVKKSQSPEGIGLAYLLFACATTAILSMLATWWIVDWKVHQAEASTRFVTVNTVKIMQRKTEDLVYAGGADPSKYAQEGKVFGAALSAALNKLAEEGYVVLNGSAVIVGGEQIDMTEAVAKQVNVDLNKTYSPNAPIAGLSPQQEGKDASATK